MAASIQHSYLSFQQDEAARLTCVPVMQEHGMGHLKIGAINDVCPCSLVDVSYVDPGIPTHQHGSAAFCDVGMA